MINFETIKFLNLSKENIKKKGMYQNINDLFIIIFD